MTHTFALRSSDNALVWVKNPPDSLPDHFSSDKVEKLYREEYQQALTQAIRDGVKVADEDKIENMIIDSGNWERDFVKVFVNPNHWKLRMKPDTPYRLDVEMEEVFQIKTKNGDDEWANVAQATYNHKHPSHEYRQVCRLIPKPKQETLKDWMNKWDDFAVPEFEPKQEEYCDGLYYCSLDSANVDGVCAQCGKPKRKTKQENDMKEKCEHIYSRSMDQPYPRLCVKCHEPEVKEPKQEGDEVLRKRIAEILRNNITFSGQVGDYVIHGAINEILKLLTPAEPKEEQWICVKDRLPDDDNQLCAFIKLHQDSVITSDVMTWHSIKTWRRNYADRYTHWMPLPTIHRK